MKKIFYSLIVVIIFSVNGNAQTATIIAGTGTGGYNGDGLPALSTELNNPAGVAFDKKGILYYADANNGLVRKMDVSGNIYTVAGSPTNSGYNGDGIAATSAFLTAPVALTFDTAGNLYIADQFNYRIRKVDTFGIITTVAGGGSAGLGDGGPATAAELFAPSGIAFDKKGNLYITDQNDARVRMVNTKGIITTVVGTGTVGNSGDLGPATSAEIAFPYGVFVDKNDNLYITDVSNYNIRKVDTAGIITTIAGTGVWGFNGDGIPATSATLSSPEGVILDSTGTIYIADGSNERLRTIDSKGIIHTLVSDTGQIIANPLSFVSALNLDANNNLYLVDAINDNIWKITTCPAAPLIYPASPTLCSGQSVTLSVNNAGATYTWSPATALSTTIGDTVTASPTSEVTYTVTSTLGSCVSTSTDTITVTPAPNKPTITQHSDTLISSAQTNNQWYLNDTLIPSATGQFLVISQQGSYSVVVTNPADGCSSNSEELVTSGINQITTNNNSLSLYPNPNNGNFTIQLNCTKRNTQVDIFNILGEKIYSAPLNSQNILFMHLNNYAQGIYLYRMSDELGNLIGIGKFIIE